VDAHKPKRILFTGYAPVHFICFKPLYDRLVRLNEVQVFLSGGIKVEDAHALYKPFHISTEKILSNEEIKNWDFDMSFSASANLVPPRSAGVRVQIFHGLSFRNRQIREQTMSYDYYFIVGPYMYRKFVMGGLLEEDDPRGLKIGFPKTDRLLNGEHNRRELLREYGLDGSRPVILYAPTGEKHNSLETMGGDVVSRLANSGRYNLLVKLHDHPKDTATDWFSKLAVFEDTYTRVVRDFDVIPLLFLADLLITDASSVSSEYSLLDRPMVFLDVPELIGRAMKKKGARVDLDTWGRRGGLVVGSPDGILEAVESSLGDAKRFAEIRIAMARDLFYNHGTATEEGMAWIEKKILSL